MDNKSDSSMHNQDLLPLKKEVGFFIALTFFFSAFFYYFIATIEDDGWYEFGLMWCPGVAAVITSLLFNKNLKGFGWGIGSSWLLLASYFYPLAELFLVYGIVWYFGFGGFAGFDANFMTKLAFLPMILMALEGTYYAGRSALGEEIGWRGYLVPRLLSAYKPNTVSIFVGLVWAVWHFPIMITGDYGSNTPLLYQLICFTLAFVGVSFIYTWFRIKSGSLWTAALLHTSGNLFIFHVFEDLTINTGNTAYYTGETGAVFALWGLVLIFLFMRFGWDWPTTFYRFLRSKWCNNSQIS
ncbi:CPBP family intramembrane glutamic endopeptidase [Thalassotalea euphylliae]|uniref:CPBP family intramembrane metalloprotease n=1 Tax=Thalassotalea euphylliae TaxID=1655234 RepID=A0A3E0UDK2_9GAMM|nr:CPBP family intramembrane glutamic endopeptidase [Thalassotalea euphylliae]REL35078.1 CPBP family intramembrane metalloprotease [Thalassotalea euphylliae]